jgi:hypothetical protein
MHKTEPNENLSEEELQAALRERLIAGYLANAEADALMAEEWRPIEVEVWDKLPCFIS